VRLFLEPMDEIVIVGYDATWPYQFEAEAARIREALDGDLITRMEHFGSTAVPGLAAKPIIDILIETPSLADAKERAVALLERMGYSYWRDNPDQERMFFVKGLPPDGPRTHHIHIEQVGGKLIERLTFRDYLRAHPDEAGRYLAIKRELAERSREDREAYTQGKTAYIESVMVRARRTTE
jgi:GrpB-like predicted nucleotidyltransferase (UPF0157 family)